MYRFIGSLYHHRSIIGISKSIASRLLNVAKAGSVPTITPGPKHISCSALMLQMELEKVKDILILEPFYGGSHKQLIDILTSSLTDDKTGDFDLVVLPPKKWHWKARCSALQFMEMVPRDTRYNTILCSSDLCLPELLGMRPDLHNSRKIVYFHENQLVYPVQKSEALDFQFGYNQIITALAADVVCFNSAYNMQTFTDNIDGFLKMIPNYKPKAVTANIKAKSRVLHFPIQFSEIKLDTNIPNRQDESSRPVLIVWPHRWEFDKNPETFFKVLLRLTEEGFNFKVAVLGQGFTDVPAIFEDVKPKLVEHVYHWGFIKSKEDYYALLQTADVVVSTAAHEFFGVSMMEATYCGCYPLCPNRLSYPELYPKDCLYNTETQLYKRLREFCLKPWLPKNLRTKLCIDFDMYSWDHRKLDYYKMLNVK